MILVAVHRRWEDEMMKQFQEQFQQEMKAMKDEYDVEKQREVADKEKDLRKEFQQGIVKVMQETGSFIQQHCQAFSLCVSGVCLFLKVIPPLKDFYNILLVHVFDTSKL